jgi:hypothetical protein
MPRHPPYALHSLSPHTQTQQKQDTPPHPLNKKEKEKGILSKTATKMLASTIQQPNNHKKTSNHTPIQVLAPDSSGPNSAPPNPPEGGPAPVSWTCRAFHTHTPASRSTSSTEHSRPHQRGQHVDDSTSEHPSAVGTNVPRASGVCSLERR